MDGLRWLWTFGFGECLTRILGMSEQLDVVLAYIEKKGKKITKKICKLCHTNTHVFYTHVYICKACWKTYLEMSKDEKKQLPHAKRGIKAHS